MKRDAGSKRASRKRSVRRNRRPRKPKAAAAANSDNQIERDEYRVGPGKPPLEFRFKPGQSGNPTGVKRKKPSIRTNLKALLEGALGKKTKLGRGANERIVTKAAAGIEKLVDEFANGNPSARRDLIALAKTLGVDLTMGQGKVIETALAEAFTQNDEAMLADHFRRYAGRYMAGAKSDTDLAQKDVSEKAGHNDQEGRAS